MAAATRTLVDDPRYLAFVQRYAFDLPRFCIEVCGIVPTHQQIEMFDSVAPPGSRTSVASGHGCFALGTEIMRADGRVAPVELVRIGDRLMGPDGASVRNVLELKRGREAMHRFTYSDGTSHVFNESHILCLVATNSKGRRVAGERITVTVREWLTWGADKKRCHAIYRSPVRHYEREAKPLPIPPYVLGAWLGDGHSSGNKFTTADPEVWAAFNDYATGMGYRLSKQQSNSGKATTWLVKRPGVISRWTPNAMLVALRDLSLIDNKHIPADYLLASFEDRLELLAGLLDTDGHQDGSSHGFEITQKNERMARQIVTLARSVGCHATVKEVRKTCANNGAVGVYWRVTIGRNIDQIPVRIQHKQIAPGERQRPNLHFSIKAVEPLGEGDYYGFVLDGDSRFLGGDFTVLHNTGKTAGYGIIGLWHLLCYHNSNTILSAPKLTTVSDGVWKEFSDLKVKIKNGMQGWIDDYYEVAAERVYVRGFKLSWWVVAKTAPRGSPENLAGAHRDWLLFLIDEASGVPDANFGVITGALTDKRNRMCIASQPTRSSGFFYDTQHTLSVAEGGAWNNLVFSSEDSPIVSVEFCAEKKKQYTPEEYDIKVLGRFSEQSSKYLLGPKAIQACVGLTVIGAGEDFGWLIPVDVGGGGYRDKSVVLALKVAGDGEYGQTARRVQLVKVPVCSNAQDVSDLPGVIIKEAGERNNAMALVDAGGIGLGVCKQLEKADFHNFKKVNWGSPNFKKEYKDRYTNQRAQAICGLSRAVQEGRFGIDEGIDPAIIKQIVREGSRIPYHYDEKARRYIAKKEDMKKDGIPSPDLWDSLSFSYLEDAYYNLSGEEAANDSGAKDAARKKLLATLGMDQEAA